MRFKQNPRLAAELTKLPAVRRLVMVEAERVRDGAEQRAPRGFTDQYRDSFVVKMHRGHVVVATEDPAGHLGEFGSANNPPYAPLRRAARAVGLEFRESPKL